MAKKNLGRRADPVDRKKPLWYRVSEWIERVGRWLSIFGMGGFFHRTTQPIGDTGVPLPMLLKATNCKSVFEINQELEAAVHQRIVDEKDYILNKHLFSKATLKLYYRLPQWARLLTFKWLFNNPFRAKKHSGTVLVTTVNAIGKSAGWILPTRSLHNLSIALGSITKKPWVVKGEVKVRDIMHMTVTFNHDVIDGVPARRFVENLVNMIEKGDLGEE